MLYYITVKKIIIITAPGGKNPHTNLTSLIRSSFSSFVSSEAKIRLLKSSKKLKTQQHIYYSRTFTTNYLDSD